MTRRSVYFLSDHTGLTAESLGQPLLAQFQNSDFKQVTVPFIRSEEKARNVAHKIDQRAEQDGVRPIVFVTIANFAIREILLQCNALKIDFFDAFINILEQELGPSSIHNRPRFHRQADSAAYSKRMDAINFALDHDDGSIIRHYDQADVIVVGVSRVGKTPTCLYLALQFGIYTANYPLVEDDLVVERLPEVLLPYRNKLFGLSIDARRLASIRWERRPHSHYASDEQCRREVLLANRFFQAQNLHHLDVTAISIEEIAAAIMDVTRLKRRFF